MTTKLEEAHRRIFRGVHADHAGCDEWLTESCRLPNGELADRPIVWSRRNGPWRQVDVLWVGAAPGNAGGRGRGSLGAHGTRIPFGGDIAGANLEVLFGSIGITRNDTFIIAALNQLPLKGGGEPTPAEIQAPVGRFANSIELLRATILASGPRLIICLGNVAVRVTSSAVSSLRPRMPSLTMIERADWMRGTVVSVTQLPSYDLRGEWKRTWPDAPEPSALWTLHPSAQNMSPFAGTDTLFHQRMLEARDHVRRAYRKVLGRSVPAKRPPIPDTGIYALPEWRERISERAAEMDRLWREKGV